MKNQPNAEHGSAAELLSDWRSAQRVTIAARAAAGVAEQAKNAASHASERSQMATATAEGEELRAGQAVEAAERAETEARDRYHDAQADGFPKGSAMTRKRALHEHRQ